MPTRFHFLPTDAPRPRPGDMIGFSGADLLADLINLGSLGLPRRGLSHVAIVANHPDGLALYESTTTVGLPCLEARETRTGLQCHLITERVIGYPGRVWHYPLTRAITYIESAQLSARLRQMCCEGRRYDYFGAFDSRSTFVGLAARAKFGRENLQALFCSEFLASEWRRLRILKTANASSWSPNALARYAVRHGLTGEPIPWHTTDEPAGQEGLRPPALPYQLAPPTESAIERG